MASTTKLKELENKLFDTRDKLERFEREQAKLENQIFTLKEEIKDILIKLETESLPTEFYNRGFKLKEEEHHFILTDRDGETIKQWSHSPSLGELFDVVNELKVCV